MVASILLTTIPMPSVSCSRKIVCREVNLDTEASSITALT